MVYALWVRINIITIIALKTQHFLLAFLQTFVNYVSISVHNAHTDSYILSVLLFQFLLVDVIYRYIIAGCSMKKTMKRQT